MTDASPKVHVFERAGLGLAPFTLTAIVERVGPLMARDGSMVGAPGQPMGTCRFCGKGIKVCCIIESRDGRQFDVGTDCVRKTGDAGLRRVITDHERAKRTARADAKREQLRAAYHEAKTLLRERLSSQASADIVRGLPHPQGFTDRATGQPLTMLDWCNWMLADCGAAGALAVCRKVNAVLDAAEGKVQ